MDVSTPPVRAPRVGAKHPSTTTPRSLTGLNTRRHPWSSYAVFQTTLTAGAIYDLFMFFSLGLASADSEWSPYWALIMTSLAVFWVFTKISKVSGHYLRYPSDICYVPLQIAFGIFHTFCIKIPAFCTMNEVSGPFLPWFATICSTVLGRHRSRYPAHLSHLLKLTTLPLSDDVGKQRRRGYGQRVQTAAATTSHQ